MSSLASHLWSKRLLGGEGGQNYRLWNETSTLPRTAIVLAHISRSWRKVCYLIILLEGFFFQDNARIHIAKVTKEWLHQENVGAWSKVVLNAPGPPRGDVVPMVHQVHSDPF